MLPVQPKVEIDLESKMHSSLEAAACAANSSMVAKGLPRICNSENTIIEVEGQFDEQIKNPDCVGNPRVAAKEDPDATDYSSSFEGTMSGTENGTLSDTEVDSCFYDDNGFAYDDFNSIFPIRKKLTSHWRSFVRPLMWRCKWAELRIKEFQSLVSKYARELAAYDQKKQLEVDQFALESFCSKSLPFSFQSSGKKLMKRRKRKRVEDTADIASYMSQHNLFSYFADKRSDPDGTSVVEEIGNPASAQQNADDEDEFDFGDDCVFHDYNDENDSLEQILWKIERAQSRVEKLKSRLVDVFDENDLQFCSFEDLPVLVPYDGQASSNHSPTFSVGHEDMELLGADVPNVHMDEYDIGDFIIPEFMAQSYEEATSVPDIIESTVSPLSSADVTMHQPQIRDFDEASMDNVLAYNQAAEVERHTSRSTQQNTTEKLQEPEERIQENGNPSVPDLEPDLGAKTDAPLNPSSLTSCLASEIHFPKSKRKRAERKVGLGGWSADPLLRDNQ